MLGHTIKYRNRSSRPESYPPDPMAQRHSSPGRFVKAAAACAGTLLVFCATGCREFEARRAQLSDLYTSGHFDQAAAMLDDPKTKEAYGAKNELLWKMDRGAVALAVKQDDQAISLLN